MSFWFSFLFCFEVFVFRCACVFVYPFFVGNVSVFGLEGLGDPRFLLLSLFILFIGRFGALTFVFPLFDCFLFAFAAFARFRLRWGGPKPNPSNLFSDRFVSLFVVAFLGRCSFSQQLHFLLGKRHIGRTQKFGRFFWFCFFICGWFLFCLFSLSVAVAVGFLFLSGGVVVVACLLFSFFLLFGSCCQNCFDCLLCLVSITSNVCYCCYCWSICCYMLPLFLLGCFVVCCCCSCCCCCCCCCLLLVLLLFTGIVCFGHVWLQCFSRSVLFVWVVFFLKLIFFSTTLFKRPKIGMQWNVRFLGTPVPKSVKVFESFDHSFCQSTTKSGV